MVGKELVVMEELTTTVTEQTIPTDRSVHHIPVNRNLNAQVAYCGANRLGRKITYIQSKPICQTCLMLDSLYMDDVAGGPND